MIKGQNAFAVLCISFIWQMVKTHMIRLRGVEGQDAFDLCICLCVLCIPYILSGSPNECCLHTCNAWVIKTWRLGLWAPLVACSNKTGPLFLELNDAKTQLSLSKDSEQRDADSLTSILAFCLTQNSEKCFKADFCFKCYFKIQLIQIYVLTKRVKSMPDQHVGF